MSCAVDRGVGATRRRPHSRAGGNQSPAAAEKLHASENGADGCFDRTSESAPMDRLAKNELLRRARTPAPLALGLVDADFFKNINTRYLLPGGDHVLTWLGQTLVNSVRTIDTVGRVGGEEFMIVAPDTNFEGAEILAERIRKTVELGETEYKGETINITVSVGVVVADAKTLVGYDQMRFAASAALSDAKKNGRNCCVVRNCPPFGPHFRLGAHDQE